MDPKKYDEAAGWEENSPEADARNSTGSGLLLAFLISIALWALLIWLAWWVLG